MRLWIDATDPRSQLPIFGMMLLERQLHAIVEARIEPTEVCVQLLSGTSSLPSLPESLTENLPLRWLRDPRPLAEQLAQAVENTQREPLLALEADAVVDSRLLRYMGEQTGSFVAQGGEGPERTAVIRFEGNMPAAEQADRRLLALAETGLKQGSFKELPLDEVPAYIKKLRRQLPPYLFRIPDEASRDRAERFLFWSNYKGSTDFFTKYVYPPLVWRAVRPLARWRVHPNVVTLFSVFLTFAAVPLFAQGRWVTGFLLAYTMSVLDSIDGKLARLTFRSSWVGNLLDHGLDIIHPPIWYLAWAWALSSGHMASPVFQAAVWMLAFYSLDRVVAALFNWRTGRSIHGYTPLDVRMRTFISRRNINLPLFMVGLIAGIPETTFFLIVLWQVGTLGFHTERLVRFWNDKVTLRAVG